MSLNTNEMSPRPLETVRGLCSDTTLRSLLINRGEAVPDKRVGFSDVTVSDTVTCCAVLTGDRHAD